MLPGDVDGDGVPDLMFEWGLVGDSVLRTRAISGANGATLWNGPMITPGAGRQPAGMALTDWNGDGVVDSIEQGGATRVVSGKNGAALATAGVGDAYYMPMVFDVDGDGNARCCSGYWQAGCCSGCLRKNCRRRAARPRIRCW